MLAFRRDAGADSVAENFDGMMAGRRNATLRLPTANAGQRTAALAASGLVALAALVSVVLLTWTGGLSEAEQRYNAGVELQMQGRLDEAVAAYDEAVRGDSELAVAYYNRANAHAGLDQYERAVQDYDASIALRRPFATAYANRDCDTGAHSITYTYAFFNPDFDP